MDDKSNNISSKIDYERSWLLRWALAINQHLHLVKGAERDKGIGIAKKGAGSRSPSLITLVIPL